MQWLNGEWERKMLDTIEGDTVEEREENTTRCIRAVMGVLLEMEDIGWALGAWRREAIRLGSHVIYRDGDGWVLAWVNSMGTRMAWEDEVVIYPLIALHP